MMALDVDGGPPPLCVRVVVTVGDEIAPWDPLVVWGAILCIGSGSVDLAGRRLFRLCCGT